MDLFDCGDSSSLVKYCLTLENEQKQLRLNQLELHQELHQELLDLKKKFHSEIAHQREKFRFLLGNCKIQYDVIHYIKYFDRGDEVDPCLVDLEKDLENLASRWVLDSSDNQFPGTRHKIWSNQHTSDVYDSLTYHQYALKMEVRHIKTKYFIEHNQGNPDFNPNLHFVLVSISVNPLTMSMINEILPRLDTLKSFSAQPRLWSPTSEEWHRRVIWDLHFDMSLKRRDVAGRPD